MTPTSPSPAPGSTSPSSTPPSSAPEGTELIGVLGSGSACLVTRVRRGGEELACKRLLPQHRTAPGARLAMVREARALTLARHPALPALREVGSDAAGPFLLETLVEGGSLRDLKEHWHGRVPARLALHVAEQAARNLRAIHALEDDAGRIELVHGDVTPDNLRLDARGEVRLLDLGNARFRGFGAELDTGAREAAPYVAPEVARGEVVASQATDVYALAATIAWLLLPGEAPLADAVEDAALLLAIGERGLDPSRLAVLPAALRDALAALLAFEPARRAFDLEPLLQSIAVG